MDSIDKSSLQSWVVTDQEEKIEPTDDLEEQLQEAEEVISRFLKSAVVIPKESDELASIEAQVSRDLEPKESKPESLSSGQLRVTVIDLDRNDPVSDMAFKVSQATAGFFNNRS